MGVEIVGAMVGILSVGDEDGVLENETPGVRSGGL